jgi:acyl dehydratase
LELTADAIKDFAKSFDPQKFHLSEAEAADTIFGELVASGWHTTALSMRLLVDGEMHLAGGIFGASMDELRWPRPTGPGDRLRLESEVVETRTLKSRPSHGLARVKMTTTNQRNGPA